MWMVSAEIVRTLTKDTLLGTAISAYLHARLTYRIGTATCVFRAILITGALLNGTVLHVSRVLIIIQVYLTGMDRNVRNVQTIVHTGMALIVLIAMIITSLYHSGMAQRASRAVTMIGTSRTGPDRSALKNVQNMTIGTARCVLALAPRTSRICKGTCARNALIIYHIGITRKMGSLSVFLAIVIVITSQNGMAQRVSRAVIIIRVDRTGTERSVLKNALAIDLI